MHKKIENDYDDQRQILDEERKENSLKHRFYRQIICLVFFSLAIIVAAHLIIYYYDDYHLNKSFMCERVNLKDDYNIYNIINITDEDSCMPKYNIDYFGNSKVLFNIDIYGDKSVIFNKINNDNVCKINCDTNEDGYPDFNVDLNGDGTADLNISNDNKKCDSNCDVNHDMIIDNTKVKINKKTLGYLNFDINYDGICDLNCDTNNDLKADYNIDINDDIIPDLNIDTDQDKVADLNIDSNSDGICDESCLGENASTKEMTINISKLEDSSLIVDLDAIEPGSEGVYTIIVNNDTHKAYKGGLYWQNINNGYNEYNNLNYGLKQNYISLLDSESLPYKESLIKEIIISPKTKVLYNINVQTNYYSSNTIFKGELIIK